MSLPELDWQIIYGPLAWGIVLAALISALWPRAWPLSRRGLSAIIVLALVLQHLPGEIAPAYWLGLAFQWPSALLVGLSMLMLHFAWQGTPEKTVMPCALAALIVATSAVLYLDAFGLLTQGFFYWGFSARGAPIVALLLAVLCSVAIVRGRARAQSLVVLGALLLFAGPRLPTGNLWDTLLDPLLSGWALVSLARACWHRLTYYRSAAYAQSRTAGPSVFKS
jgi:hypothetical protein